MNRKSLILTAIGFALVAATLAGCQSGGGGSASPPASSGAVPPVAADPIANPSTAPGLSITAAAVEDNVDPATGKPIDDRLQITLTNSTAAPLTKVEIYYEMTDVTTKKSEGYYQALDGVTIPANGETTVFFDNETGAGHFPENTFSLYRSSANQVDFTIEASADGVKIATATATKGAGTGEQAD